MSKKKLKDYTLEEIHNICTGEFSNEDKACIDCDFYLFCEKTRCSFSELYLNMFGNNNE